MFANKFLEFVEKCIPSKVILVRNDDKPWYDSEIRKYSRIRDRLKTKASKSKNQNDWSIYKRTRNKVNNLKKHAKELFYNSLENILLENSSNNKRDYWRVIRHFVKNNNSKSCIPPMCSPVDNKYSYTDRDIAEILNSFFTSVSKVNDEYAILPNFIAKTGSTLHSVNVTSDQIEALIKSLNLNKASGPDLISHKMLKGAAKAVSKPLTILFNRSLDESVFPDTWKIANVIPIYKKGLASDPSNYRPISLLCSIGKLLERLVFKDIYNYLHENDILYKYQSGFVPNHSTTFQLIDIYHQICRTFDNHQYSCMVFLIYLKLSIGCGIRVFCLN